MVPNVEEFTIPECTGRMFKVRKGQTLRVIQVEGVQAADLIAMNLHNLKESYCAWLTWALEETYINPKKLYGKLPGANVMFTVLTAKPGLIWLSPGRCSRPIYEKAYGVKSYHLNCQDILADLIEPYGLTAWDVPDVINLFMTAAFKPDGGREIKMAPVKKGDFVELRAEMDLLCGISNCPDELGIYNDHKTKPLGVQIFD